MSTTKQIPREQWTSYFERFTRQQLGNDPTESITIEVVSPQVGDQFETTTARLLGLSYDPKSEAFDVLMEDAEHLAFQPTEIWVVEEEPSFISIISLGHADGTKEIFYIQRSGPPATRSDQPPA
jgi:hypothetical protein